MLLANFPGLERHMADQHYKVIVDRLRSRARRNPLSRQSESSRSFQCWAVLVVERAKILAGVALDRISLAHFCTGCCWSVRRNSVGIFGGTVATFSSDLDAVATAAGYIGVSR
jgi:hypothetical protein